MKVELIDGEFAYASATLLVEDPEQKTILTAAGPFLQKPDCAVCPRAWFVSDNEEIQVWDIVMFDKSQNALALGFLDDTPAYWATTPRAQLRQQGVHKGSGILVPVLSGEDDGEQKNALIGAVTGIELASDRAVTIACPEILPSYRVDGAPVFTAEDGAVVGVCFAGVLLYIPDKMRRWVSMYCK